MATSASISTLVQLARANEAIQDDFTKWPEVELFRSAPTGEDTVKAIIRVIARHGVPEEIITDNGSHFVNQLMHEVTTRLRIKHTRAPPLDKKQTNWDRAIQVFLYAYRTTEHQSTGFTPFKMLTGREAVHPGSTVRLVALNESAGKDIDLQDATKLIVEGIQAIHEKARVNMDRAKQRVAARERDLPWRTVGIVEKKTGPVTYKVRVCGDQTAKTINVDRLKASTPPLGECIHDGAFEVPESHLERLRAWRRPHADTEESIISLSCVGPDDE
uniref:Integrase catalytic domain-containing protein n=1 Tax=Vitrella brassicaformis TaxID=1169539 RepID=A0A7S1JKA8_9ALVE|mmetsp:Transcript_12705/g.30313  ORF Transcript_12705/g.30313 Transcript_12705/m.30313 type:complete len:273 (+) Transcript_12705:539-1357(+)